MKLPELTEEMKRLQDICNADSVTHRKEEREFVKILAEQLGLRPSRASGVQFHMNNRMLDHPRGLFTDGDKLYEFYFPYKLSINEDEKNRLINSGVTIEAISNAHACYNTDATLLIVSAPQRNKRKNK